ncbi:MAG: hypothetical protein QW416_05860 [Candidatus Nitrosocaldaceae archaeon]
MSKENISKPPINILFNPNLIQKKSIWEIDLSSILNTLLKILDSQGRKDLRICGIAALSSAMILRLKVESIFVLEKLASQKKHVIDDNILNNISKLEMPYRFESKYPVSIEDLLKMLESMLEVISKPKESIELQPIDSNELDKYLVTFEELLEEYKDDILERIKVSHTLLFSEFVKGMDSIDSIRYFIAILYLAMHNKIEIEELENDILLKIII